MSSQVPTGFVSCFEAQVPTDDHSNKSVMNVYCVGPECPFRQLLVRGGGGSTPDIYKHDSPACVAAIHAGVISQLEAPAKFQINSAGRRNSLEGRSAHGIQSWSVNSSSNDDSFATFSVLPYVSRPPDTTTKSAKSVKAKTSNSNKAKIIETFPPCGSYVSDSCTGTFQCPGATCTSKTRYGTLAVYGLPFGGELVFTGDSVPCRAAKFLGIISAETGGVFEITPCGGRSSFEGSEQAQNGISISKWRTPYDVCFRVCAYTRRVGQDEDEDDSDLTPMKKSDEVQKCVIEKEEYF